MGSSKATAYSPGHITGFFRVHLQEKDTRRVGSTGAGVAIDQGVVTEVAVRRSRRPRAQVFFNEKPLKDPVVSRAVIREYQGTKPDPVEVQVSHKSTLPIGRGYGTSGAGALGLSLALNEVLGKPLTTMEAASIAHKAEVNCRTGLGTVTAAFHGGFTARLKPGDPETGEIRKLPVSKSDRIVSATYGPMSTSRILSHDMMVNRVNDCGRALVGRLLKRPRLDRFLEISRGFTDCLNLVSPRLSRLLRLMGLSGIVLSMMMIGDGAFTVAHREEARNVSEALRKLGLRALTSRVSSKGARLI